MENNIKFSGSSFDDWVYKIERNSLYEVIFAIIFASFMIFAFVLNANNDIYLFAGTAGICIITGVYLYGSTIYRVKAITHTVKRIKKDGSVILETYSFSLFKLFRIPSSTIRVDIDNSILKESAYPLMDKMIPSKVIQIVAENRVYYIIPECYELDSLKCFYDKMK